MSYDMRICDLSADVSSSDLLGAARHIPANIGRMMGRSFRVGGGPHGLIVHAGLVRELNATSRSASKTTFGDKHRVMVEHIPVRPCTPSQSIQLEDELDVKMLRHALNFSTARIDGHCPKWEFPIDRKSVV